MRPSQLFLSAFFAVAFFINPSEEFGSGAPPKACLTMLPVHGDIKPQASTAPYIVRAASSQVNQGKGINVTISSPTGTAIRGFLLQARSIQGSDLPLGSWSSLPALTKTTTCNGTADTVTHTSTAEKANLVFQWNAPNDFLGAVVFKATVAEGYPTFWSNVDSTLVEVVTKSTIITTTVPPQTTVSKADNTRPSIQQTTSLPAVRIPFYDGCDSTKLCFGSSPNCIENQNCVAAVSVFVTGDTYTFELRGINSPAYVAAGLSDDDKMGDDSSMECTQVNGQVSLYTSWTYPKSDPYVSRNNVPQGIVQLKNKSFRDGVLSCVFVRDTVSTVRNKEFDLAKDKYHLMIVSGDKVEADHVGFHSVVFEKTGTKLALSEVGNVASASKLLLRLHGSFMLIAWIGTASCGILLARYYRQTWVGKQLGGKDIWFAWHRVFMVLTWLLTVSAFIIILVEVGGWANTGDNPHAIIGIVTVILCFLQPIGAFFRPHPNTPRRPIFNWLHWLAGNLAHILGIVTIFFAVYLNKAELPDWMVFILVAFVIFHVIMHFVLSIAMCVSDGRISNGRVNSFPMKDLMTNNRQSANNDRKMEAPHAGFRKLMLGIYFVVIAVFVIALVCIVSLAPIEETYESVSKAIMGSDNN